LYVYRTYGAWFLLVSVCYRYVAPKGAQVK
jgi:hypothetical protein